MAALFTVKGPDYRIPTAQRRLSLVCWRDITANNCLQFFTEATFPGLLSGKLSYAHQMVSESIAKYLIDGLPKTKLTIVSSKPNFNFILCFNTGLKYGH